MYYKDDFLLKQINLMIETIVRAYFGGNKESTIKSKITDEIKSKVALGEIGEAEDILFSEKEKGNYYREDALLFYKNLNRLEDRELFEMQFSRDEIKEGLIDYFGIENFLFLKLGEEK